MDFVLGCNHGQLPKEYLQGIRCLFQLQIILVGSWYNVNCTVCSSGSSSDTRLFGFIPGLMSLWKIPNLHTSLYSTGVIYLNQFCCLSPDKHYLYVLALSGLIYNGFPVFQRLFSSLILLNTFQEELSLR